MNKLSRLIGQKQADEVVFVCIGTDRSTGDALGPLVGTELVKRGYPNVYGTLENPVHALNLEETIHKLPKDKTVIAIDASLGSFSDVGVVKYKHGPIYPGAGVGKNLPAVGDYSITGVVNIGGFMEHFVLQNTRLSRVMRMADEIVATIEEAIPCVQDIEIPWKKVKV